MEKTYTLGSLFDGSGGFGLAGALCGIKPVWASEVEPYPIAVTTSRFPNMKHYGDVSKVNGAEVEPVDIITFGSPCQDMSIAGKRAGLKHESKGDDETTRSGLFMEAIRIIKEMRKATNGKYPRFAIWENVTGTFSSNKGEDFRVVLEELIRIKEPSAAMPPVPRGGGWNYADCYRGDGWSLAYRTFDAQYWGVPQRRRRIYLVFDFAGQCAGDILFKRTGLSGNSAASSQERESAAASSGKGAAYAVRIRGCCNGGGKTLIQEEKPEKTIFCMATQQGGAEIRSDDIAPTLTAAAGMSGNNQPVLLKLENSEIAGVAVDAEKLNCAERFSNGSGGQVSACLYAAYGTKWNGNGGAYSGCRIVEIAKTLDTTNPAPSKNQGGICILDMSHACDIVRDCGDKSPCLQARMGTGGNQVPLVAYGVGNGQVSEAMGMAYEKAQTLNTMHDAEAILQCAAVDCRNGTESQDVNGMLQAKPNGGISCNTNIVCRVGKTVRRLTPTECARLQGFPDEWGNPIKKDSFSDEEYEFWHEVKNTHEVITGKTPKKYKKKQLLNWYNKLHTDSSEYKMWGNGIALPCALYCMEGIKESLMN